MRAVLNAQAPFISVVVPHLNQPEQLRACLSSLKAQTLDAGRFEVFVVDNGSNVLPESVCSCFDGVELLQETTPGPGPARNRGVEASRGSILAFIDADCLAEHNWLATIDITFGRNPTCEIIGGDVRIARGDMHKATMLEAYESIYAYRQQDYIQQQGFSGTGNLAFHRRIYEKVGAFAGKDVAEDRDWGRRATGLGFRIEYVAEMIVFHPARASFSELCVKWDRHVSHDFEEQAKGVLGRLRWLALTVAVLGSPVLEARRLITSRRVSTWQERYLAAFVLTRIRIYRARKMFEMLVRGKSASASKAWNTE